MPEQPSNFSEFDAAAAGEALGARPHLTRDVAHGDGAELEVGETTLEVYRDAGVARVTTPDARIELFRVPSYTISGERVVFEQGDQGDQDDRSRLLIRNDGKVSFYPVLRATEPSRTADTTSSGHQDSPAPTTPPDNVTRQNDGTSTSPEGEKGGEVQQMQLHGRLGRDPWFSTRDDRPAAGFPLAVNPPDGSKAIWHDVVTFDETAGQLDEAFKKRQIMKGKPVAVTGQTVIREEPRANGGMKKSAEFHATAVTRVQSRGTRPGR
jgi:hypothetical protein